MAKSTEEMLAIMKAGSKKGETTSAEVKETTSNIEETPKTLAPLPRVVKRTNAFDSSDPILEILKSIERQIKHTNYYLMQLRNKSIDIPMGNLEPDKESLNGENT